MRSKLHTLRVGDRMRVIAPGKFHGQVAQVLEKTRSVSGRITYELDVTWDGVSRPSYFGEEEVEAVQDERETATHE